MAGSLLGDLLQRGEDLPWRVLGQESLREEGEGRGGERGEREKGERGQRERREEEVKQPCVTCTKHTLF